MAGKTNKLKRRDLRLMWSSNSHWSMSGYGVFTRDLLFRLRDDGWKWRCDRCHANRPAHEAEDLEKGDSPELKPSTELPAEHICPACRVGRDDYEGEPNKYLPTCPNCGSASPPVEIGAEERES